MLRARRLLVILLTALAISTHTIATNKKNRLLPDDDSASLSSEYVDDENAIEAYENDDKTAVLIICQAKDDTQLCNCDTSQKLITCRPGNSKRSESELLHSANIQTANAKFEATHIYLSSNRIHYISQNTLPRGQEKSLQVIDFVDNDISHIKENSFDKFKNLTKLRLSKNFISIERRGDIGWITRKLGKTLEKLYLGYNMIQRIADGAFDPLVNMRQLRLDGNPGLVLRDTTFGVGLAKLEMLSLDNCRLDLKTLPSGVFEELKGLKGISLRGNSFSSVPAAIRILPSLEILDLSQSNITEITQNAFAGAKNLKRLLITSMPYMYELAECAFCGMENLEEIDVTSSKKLYSIDINAFGYARNESVAPKKLKRLLLEKCKIETLPKELLPWKKLDALSIGGNPFNCDQKLQWLIDDYSHLVFVHSEVPTCDKPESLHGMKLQKLKTLPGAASIADTGDAAASIAKGGGRVLTKVFYLIIFLVTLTGGILLGVTYWNRHFNGNPFYRPQMPRSGFTNVSTGLHLDDEFNDDEDTSLSQPQAV